MQRTTRPIGCCLVTEDHSAQMWNEPTARPGTQSSLQFCALLDPCQVGSESFSFFSSTPMMSLSDSSV